MATKKDTYLGWGRDDRDLLIELKTKMGGLSDDIKEIKETTITNIANLQANAVSKVVADDHEVRIRFIERYMWLALGSITVISFALNYFHPFA